MQGAQVGTQLQSELRAFIRALPNAKLGPDPMSEEAYFYGRFNFAHFHGPRHVDVRLSIEEQRKALDQGKAHPHLWAPRAGWVSCTLEDGEDLDAAKELVRRAHDHWESVSSRRQ